MAKMTGQTALVTGSANGIGKAIAKKLASEGAYVWITDIDEEAGNQVVREIVESNGKASFLRLDVRSSQEVAAAIRQIYTETGRMDILVNNAGISGNLVPVDQMSDEEWKVLLDIHVNGSFYCLREAARYMKKQGYGRIINMSSLASETALRGFVHYATAKYALVGLTESSAKDLAPYGITVNVLKPGIIRSALTGGVLQAAEERLARSTPVRSIGSAEDVAMAAAFLASPDSGFLTGISIVVDGGFRLVSEMDKVTGEMIAAMQA
ncbi:SDR family NAD(P)-dependent oxidoreductase [Bacillus badius]|uniref:3-oxoacyl-[acyl-carrier protein] reductase n=1 Tax=Bacillus badius TaxID=1455 RepID=A0ABR5ATY4_BACBA|nr:SDR family NAD(P)-dependent oxidoreductase [Bacillus badius]KIL72763.1 3-oxoacyl-[acyl-carrier protein] reductase [Bacillus badius]KIL78216.1 3-oxoacyl-[acyl-carrier protein] reductase [Bacillus badius]MED4718675.1 SDR family NAD(P)-dependent oxidoreductase [Bacillus badius]